MLFVASCFDRYNFRQRHNQDIMLSHDVMHIVCFVFTFLQNKITAIALTDV